MTYFFTSDTHFNHDKVIEYSHRPFDNVEEMNEGLIWRWNSKVGRSDIVYHLGDFGFLKAKGRSPREEIQRLLKRLNGSVNLVLGNHDRQNYNEEVKNCFASVADLRDKTLNGQRIIMCHYAMRVWPGWDKGSWMLYGHSHNKLPSMGNSFDVGVDCHDYYPLAFEEVRERMVFQNTVERL